MPTITGAQIRSAIAAFLNANYDAKKSTNAANLQDYHPDHWIAAKAIGFAQKLKFGTHISKGVHPSSSGNTIYFTGPPEPPANLVGFQHIPAPRLDASGNAADLPLVKFLAIIVDENSGTTLQDLLLADHPALAGVFAEDAARSAEYQRIFRQALRGENQAAASDYRNKQILWPLGTDAITQNHYINLIPLHSSALAYHLWQQISDTRKNWKIREENGIAYSRYHDLGKLQIGGSNSQGVSALNSKQHGINYLLPALPPQYERPAQSHIHKNSSSFYNTALRYQCRSAANTLHRIVKAKRNNLDTRNLREQALEEMTCQILVLAENLRDSRPPGWSAGYPKLDRNEQRWLDPGRSEAKDTDNDDWMEAISDRFGNWLNQWLRDKYPAIANDIGDIIWQAWRKTLLIALQAAARRARRTA